MHKIFNLLKKAKPMRISTKVRKSGKEAILLIHGIGCSKDSFQDIWKFRQFNDYSIICPDLVGFGSSSKPADFDYTVEAQADLLKMLLDNSGIKKAHIVGHSMGGVIGLLLAEKLLDNCLSFADVEGNLISEDCSLISRKAASSSFQNFKSRVFNEIKTAMTNSKASSSILWDNLSRKSSPLAFYKSAKSLVEWSDSGQLLEKFIRLKVKKAYFYGDANKEMKVLKELEGTERIPIAGSGHFAMNDNPKDFYSKLAKFISAH